MGLHFTPVPDPDIPLDLDKRPDKRTVAYGTSVQIDRLHHLYPLAKNDVFFDLRFENDRFTHLISSV
jgi:hypothetical protein